MPIVKEEVVTKKTWNVYYCDVCGKNADAHQCCGCGKLFCHYCQDNWNYYEDRPYCDQCWGIGALYRDQIEECEQQMVNLRKAWDNACKL